MVMNMIQIDIPMPTCCFDCPLIDYEWDGNYCGGEEYKTFIEKVNIKQDKPSWCPLKEVNNNASRDWLDHRETARY